MGEKPLVDRSPTERPAEDRRSPDVVSAIATFLAESPSAAGAGPDELAEAIALHWPDATPDDIERSFRVSALLRDARLAESPTDLQWLINMSRLMGGTAAAATLVIKYALDPQGADEAGRHGTASSPLRGRARASIAPAPAHNAVPGA
ncbi:MAG: hypothetical protein JWR08_495 [Enterovirga sp.]|jgi:hypothetical protein|nr:hypothetical protein [Enterovirga sp.]